MDEVSPTADRLTVLRLSGTPADWAQGSLAIARDDADGQLPQPPSRGSYRLDDEYVTMARRTTSRCSKAGVQLPTVLNKALR